MIFIDVVAEIKPEKKIEFMLTIDQIVSELKENIVNCFVNNDLIGSNGNVFNARFSLNKEMDYNSFCSSEGYAALTGSLKVLCTSYTIETTKLMSNKNISMKKEVK